MLIDFNSTKGKGKSNSADKLKGTRTRQTTNHTTCKTKNKQYEPRRKAG